MRGVSFAEAVTEFAVRRLAGGREAVSGRLRTLCRLAARGGELREDQPCPTGLADQTTYLSVLPSGRSLMLLVVTGNWGPWMR